MEIESFMGGVNGGLRGESERGATEEIRLPIGFRFRPTDEELLLHYLKRKALSLPLPASIIPNYDVFRSDPWALPGDSREKKRFYFWKGEKGLGGKCTHGSATTTSSGFWNAIGLAKQIVASNGNSQQVIGTRKLWAFYQEQHSPHGWFKTNWFIHEFRLSNVATHETSPNLNPDGQMRDWAVFKVFQRKRKQKKHRFAVSEPALCIKDCNLGMEMPSYIDFKLGNESSDLGPPESEPSSPC